MTSSDDHMGKLVGKKIAGDSRFLWDFYFLGCYNSVMRQSRKTDISSKEIPPCLIGNYIIGS